MSRPWTNELLMSRSYFEALKNEKNALYSFQQISKTSSHDYRRMIKSEVMKPGYKSHQNFKSTKASSDFYQPTKIFQNSFDPTFTRAKTANQDPR